MHNCIQGTRRESENCCIFNFAYLMAQQVEETEKQTKIENRSKKMSLIIHHISFVWNSFMNIGIIISLQMDLKIEIETESVALECVRVFSYMLATFICPCVNDSFFYIDWIK